MINGKAPPAELLLLVKVEDLSGMIAALGKVRNVLMAMPVEFDG